MKTLLNWITSVWNVVLSMTLTSFFFCQNYIQQHRKIPLYFLGELDHPVSLIFSYEHFFWLSASLVSVSLLEDREKYESYFSSLDEFLDGALVAGALVYLSVLGNFLILFSISYSFSETLNSLRTVTSFSALEIFLILMTFLVFGGNISCVKLIFDPVQNNSKNHSLTTPKETILENKHLFLVKNVHVYICRIQANVQCCFPWGSLFSCPFG